MWDDPVVIDGIAGEAAATRGVRDRVGQRAGSAARPERDHAGAGGTSAALGAGGWHPQLGLLHHRPARGDGGYYPGDHPLRQAASTGPGAVPHRRAVSRVTSLLRCGRARVVPPWHPLGAGGYGLLDGAGLP